MKETSLLVILRNKYNYAFIVNIIIIWPMMEPEIPSGLQEPEDAVLVELQEDETTIKLRSRERYGFG